MRLYLRVYSYRNFRDVLAMLHRLQWHNPGHIVRILGVMSARHNYEINKSIGAKILCKL